MRAHVGGCTELFQRIESLSAGVSPDAETRVVGKGLAVLCRFGGQGFQMAVVPGDFDDEVGHPRPAVVELAQCRGQTGEFFTVGGVRLRVGVVARIADVFAEVLEGFQVGKHVELAVCGLAEVAVGEGEVRMRVMACRGGVHEEGVEVGIDGRGRSPADIGWT